LNSINGKVSIFSPNLDKGTPVGHRVARWYIYVNTKNPNWEYVFWKVLENV
jgi:hypothetical protein